MSAVPKMPVQIVSHGETRQFTLAEANETLPLVQRITAESCRELEPVQNQIRNLLPSDPRSIGVQGEYEQIVKTWISKMERLGVVVKGLWIVNFDTGDGYLCWKFPELRVLHYREYAGGFASRQPVEKVIEELSPDWA